MASIKLKIERIKTGIPGLDELIEGGFTKNSITLLAGSSGTGKTTFSIQFLYNGVVNFNEPGIYIGLGENIERIKQASLRFGMDLEKLAENDSLIFADIPALEIDDIKSMIDSLNPKYKRLVIDPISALTFKYDSNLNMRQTIRDLIELIREKGISQTIISTEVLENSESISRFGEEFLCDNVIVLYYFREGARRFRGIEIRKARMTNHSDLIHLYKISSEDTEQSGKPSGIYVYPKEKVFRD
ncbi:MAG: RAD55 family ATPase [Promethearchaeota archaeon]